MVRVIEARKVSRLRLARGKQLEQNMTATLTATSDPGARGQQYVAAVTGTTKQHRLLLTYLGRRESGTSTVEAVPGLYVVRDVTTSRKVSGGGAAIVAERCLVVWTDDGTDVATDIPESQALELAARLDKGRPVDWHAIGCAALIDRHLTKLSDTAHDPDAKAVRLGAQIGTLAPGERTRGAINAARRAEIVRLSGETPDRPIEIDDAPSDPAYLRAHLEAEAADLRTKLAAIESRLAALSVRS